MAINHLLDLLVLLTMSQLRSTTIRRIGHMKMANTQTTAKAVELCSLDTSGAYSAKYVLVNRTI
jgi:glucose-6-phosphate 1-dehydrogenase